MFHSPQSAIRTRKGRRGAVAAEMALLGLFVYVPLIIGALHIAWLATGRQRVHDVNHYALLGEGNQSELLADRGEMTVGFFREFTGQLEVQEDDGDDPDVPDDDELRELWEAFREPIHHHHVSARGSFHLVGGRVVYRETVHVDDGYRVRPEGQCVEDWALLDDQIPERVTDLLQDYVVRRKVRTLYRHSWVHDDDPVMAGDQRVEGWNLDVPMDPDEVPWTPETAVRGDKTRMCGDQTPPAASQRDQVGTPAQFPEPEPTDDFWHPCEGPADEEDPAP